MKKWFTGCTRVSGNQLGMVYSPHPTDPRVTIERRKSDKPVLLVEETQAQDAAFGLLVKVGGRVLDAIRIGFPPDKKRKKGMPRFVSENMLAKVATGERIDPEEPYDPRKKVYSQFEGVIDYERLIVAKGPLDPVTAEITLNVTARQLTVAQEADTFEGTYSRKNDRVFLLVYDKGKKSLTIELKPRGENGSTVIELPRLMNLDSVVCYIFARSLKKWLVSDSVYILPKRA